MPLCCTVNCNLLNYKQYPARKILKTNIIVMAKKIFTFLFVFFISASTFAQKSFESEFERLTDSIFTNPGLPGMIVSYVCGDTKWERAKGYSDLEKKTPMKIDNTYRIGSLTKTFTISVLLQLVDEGKISLEDKLSKFLPDFPNGNNITIRMLADMRSGLYNYSEAPAFDDSLEFRPKKVWTNQELIDFALTFSTYFAPNTDFHYSNTNTILIGMIIEKLTNSKLSDEVSKRIIVPLGLKNTYMASGTKIKGNYSHGYMKDSTASSGLKDVTNFNDVSWAGAAGDMVSDINDIKIYLRALGKGLLYSEKMKNERTKFESPLGPAKYGIGLFLVGKGFVGHNGGIPGFTNLSVYNPEKDCSYIVMFNTQSDISPDRLCMRLMQVAGDW